MYNTRIRSNINFNTQIETSDTDDINYKLKPIQNLLITLNTHNLSNYFYFTFISSGNWLFFE